MALGNVIMTDSDGNIPKDISSSTEKVCGPLFDISALYDFWTKGAGLEDAPIFKYVVVEINTLDEAEALGSTKYRGEYAVGQTCKDLLDGSSSI